MKAKKLLSFLLVFTMLLSCCPMAVAAGVVDSGSCGDNVTWELTSDGTLTISGTGAIASYAFDKASITSVVIEEGVTSIGDRAFEKCTGLTSVVIGEDVTAIGNNAFIGCTGLTEIIFEGSAPTSIGASPFIGVTATVYYPGDSSWTREIIQRLDVNTLTWKISGIASGTCGIRLDWGLRADGVLMINGDGYMEYYLEGSSSTVTLPPWYEYREDIREVVLPQGLLDINYDAFSGCINLTKITIPDSVKYISGGAFSGCINLTEINIPDGVHSIGNHAFSECTSLRSITIPSSVAGIEGGAFSGCTGLRSITFEGDAPAVVSGAFEGVSATGYYPYDNETWMYFDFPAYDGITWEAYGLNPYAFSFTPTPISVTKGETADISLLIFGNISVLGGTVTISAKDDSGNELEISSITPNDIPGCEISAEGSKILIATLGTTIPSEAKIADISFATDADTAPGVYVVDLVSDLYTGDTDSDANDREIEFAVFSGDIMVSEKPVTVIWKNEDGTVLETDENVRYGSTPVYNSATPKKASTAQYDYTFKGWTPAVGAVTTDTVYTATYTQTLRNYTLTFKNEAGDTVKILTVPYGTEPGAIDGIPEVPAKASTAEFDYTPKDWGVQKVTGDATYTASYTETKRSYNLTWLDDDGSELGTTTVEYGTMPSFDEPTKAQDVGYTYAFKQWSPNLAAVTGETTYTATYTKTARTYAVSVAGIDAEATLVIKDADGNEIQPTNGVYNLTYNQAYTYELTAFGYKTEIGSFTVLTGNSGLVFNSDEGTAVLTFGDMEKFIGDLNGDGVITMTEAQALYNYILGRYEVNEDGLAFNENGDVVFNLNVADINGNGMVGADDILPMLRLINRVAVN